MNERIKELAKQTGYIWHASGDPQVYEFTPEKLEKFADLIVKECMRMCDVAEHAYITQGLEVPIQGCRTAKEYIADWFEVKE